MFDTNDDMVCPKMSAEALAAKVRELEAEIGRLNEPPHDLYPEWTGAVMRAMGTEDGEKLVRLMHSHEMQMACQAQAIFWLWDHREIGCVVPSDISEIVRSTRQLFGR